MPPASAVSPQAAILSPMKPTSALRTISDRESLRQAWKEISKRNKLSKGLDNVTIKAFKARLDENLEEISVDLRASRYTFSKLRAHAINKPGSNKPRPLQIASVRDRVVMKSIALYIEPVFRRFNLECSFAFIKGRGVKPAIERIHDLVEKDNKFYFETDIINFFGAVDREVLWQMFSKHVRHKSILPLLRKCFNLELEDLSSHETEFQNLFLGSDSGVPQGGVLSPMLANFYLHEFDRRMLQHGFNLVRYADDLVVMCKTRNETMRAYELCRQALNTLGLQIHPLGEPGSKSKIGEFSKDHLIFLGVRFEGKEVMPADKVIKRFEAKVQEVLDSKNGASLFKTLQKLGNLINGWGKCYQSMRVYDIYLRLDSQIKASVEKYLRDLGVELIGKNRRKHMKLLGVPSLIAMVEYRKKSDRQARHLPSVSQSETLGRAPISSVSTSIVEMIQRDTVSGLDDERGR
jgi:RNA-directed DNA polymerase